MPIRSIAWMGISQNSDFVADISKEHRGQPTVVSDTLREMLFFGQFGIVAVGVPPIYTAFR